jgi:hypothetical protein
VGDPACLPYAHTRPSTDADDRDQALRQRLGALALTISSVSAWYFARSLCPTDHIAAVELDQHVGRDVKPGVGAIVVGRQILPLRA